MSKDKSSLSSDRALEAFDSLPADSEYSTDDAAKEVTEEEWSRRIATLPEYFEIAVDVTVSLPDGTRLSYSEAVERDAPDDYDLGEVSELLDAVTEVMARRLGRS